MKHASIASIAVAVGLFLMPLGQVAQGASSPKVVFVTKYSPIEFTFPPGWHRNKESNPYELHCFSKDEDMVTGVFVFKKEDLAATSTPIDILNRQIEDMQSKRRNFKVREPLSRSEKGDSVFTTVTYVGEKDFFSKNHYKFTLIEFKSDANRFAVVLQVGLPGDWKDAKPILEGITNSARPLRDEN